MKKNRIQPFALITIIWVLLIFTLMPLVMLVAGARKQPPPDIWNKADYLREFIQARIGDLSADSVNAAAHYDYLLAQEPDDIYLYQQALKWNFHAGKIKRALILAQQTERYATSSLTPLLSRYRAELLLNEALRRKDYAQALIYLGNTEFLRKREVFKDILSAHLMTKDNKSMEAIALLEAREKQSDDPRLVLHKALIHEKLGNISEARSLAESLVPKQLAQSADFVRMELYIRLFPDKAKDMLVQFYQNPPAIGPYGPFLWLKALKENKLEKPPSLRQTLALLYCDLAEKTLQSNANPYGEARGLAAAALRLDAKQDRAAWLAGQLWQYEGHPERASAAYFGIDDSSPYFEDAQRRLGYIEEDAAKAQKAIVRLQGLLKENDPPRLLLQRTLASMYYRAQMYDDALYYYALTIEGMREYGMHDLWSAYIERANLYIEMDAWELAQSDMIEAHKLAPENPIVLNFLGYSWADRGVHLDKALAYLLEALRRSPNSGAIIDSVGWVYYRMGYYKRAVNFIEQAIRLDPTNSVIMDHLGDAYWHDERPNEARNSWRKAYQLSDDEEERAVIGAKMTDGLRAAHIERP